MISNSNRNAGTQNPAAKWLIVLALVWSQASIAAHQFEHSIGDVGKACTTCAQFDRQDDVVIPTEVSCAEYTAAPEFTPPVILAINSRAYTHYQSRASP